MTTTLTTIMTLTLTVKSAIVLTIILNITMTMMRIMQCPAMRCSTVHTTVYSPLLFSSLFSFLLFWRMQSFSEPTCKFPFLILFYLILSLLANLSCVYVHYTTFVFSLMIFIHIHSFHSQKLYYFSLKIDENCQILSQKSPVNKIYFT